MFIAILNTPFGIVNRYADTREAILAECMAVHETFIDGASWYTIMDMTTGEPVAHSALTQPTKA
jgi:hypothetical protein